MRGRIGVVGISFVLALSACGGSAKSSTPKVFHVGAFHVGLDHVPGSFPAMKAALEKLGYHDGNNIIIEWRNLADEAAADAQAKAFVKEKVDLIVAFENQTARASKAATKTIPILFLHVTNPIDEGFVKSLSSPGGNMTGTVGFRDLPAKQLEKLKTADPKAHKVVLLVDPKDPTTPKLIAASVSAARTLGFTPLERHASTQAEMETVFAKLKPGAADSVILVSPTLQTKFTSFTIAQAAEHHLAFLSVLIQWVDGGAFMAYGPDLKAIGKEAAGYVVKLLKGTRPQDLPVVELTQLQLGLNLKTARQLGITVPQAALDLADHVVR